MAAVRGGGTASIISGQAALVHLDGWTWEEMDVKQDRRDGHVVSRPFTGGWSARCADMPAALRGPTFADARRTYEAQLRELKEFFEEARRYQKAKASGTPGFKTDLKFEAMLPVLEGKVPLLAMTARERAIRDAVQFADERKG